MGSKAADDERWVLPADHRDAHERPTLPGRRGMLPGCSGPPTSPLSWRESWPASIVRPTTCSARTAPTAGGSCGYGGPAPRRAALRSDLARLEMARVHDEGIFVVELAADPGRVPDRGHRTRADRTAIADDPYRFWPTLGDVDLHLIGEGTHRRLWDALGAHARRHEGVDGTAFAVWAPAARSVRVVGDFNGWDGRAHPMRLLGSSGVWELFVPGAGPDHHYKFEVNGSDGQRRAEGRSARPGRRAASGRRQHRHDVDATCGATASGSTAGSRDDPVRTPLTIYEVHLGSWRPGARAIASSRRCSPTTSSTSASRTSSCSRSPSIRSAARGGTRCRATTRPPRGTARPTTSGGSSTTSTSAASA